MMVRFTWILTDRRYCTRCHRVQTFDADKSPCVEPVHQPGVAQRSVHNWQQGPMLLRRGVGYTGEEHPDAYRMVQKAYAP